MCKFLEPVKGEGGMEGVFRDVITVPWETIQIIPRGP